MLSAIVTKVIEKKKKSEIKGNKQDCFKDQPNQSAVEMAFASVSGVRSVLLTHFKKLLTSCHYLNSQLMRFRSASFCGVRRERRFKELFFRSEVNMLVVPRQIIYKHSFILLSVLV